MQNKTIEDYTYWCDLMGLNPSHAQNIEKYNKICKRMNQPKWEVKAKFQNGNQKTYILCNLDIENLPQVLMIAEEEDIYLQIYKITDSGERTLIFDGLFLQLASKADKSHHLFSFQLNIGREVEHGNQI